MTGLGDAQFQVTEVYGILLWSSTTSITHPPHLISPHKVPASGYAMGMPTRPWHTHCAVSCSGGMPCTSMEYGNNAPGTELTGPERKQVTYHQLGQVTNVVPEEEGLRLRESGSTDFPVS